MFKYMKCISCGTELQNGQAFCPYCGTQQVAQQAQPQNVMPEQQNPYQQYGQYQQPQQPQYQQPQQPQQQPQQNYQQNYQQNPYQQYGQPQQQAGQYQQYGQYQQPQQQYAPQGQQSEGNEALCAFAHLGGLFWLGLIDGTPAGKKAATQGLWACIVAAAVSVACFVLSLLFGLIPYVGGILGILIWLAEAAAMVAICVFAIIGVVKTFNKQPFEFPIVGKYKIFDK